MKYNYKKIEKPFSLFNEIMGTLIYKNKLSKKEYKHMKTLSTFLISLTVYSIIIFMLYIAFLSIEESIFTNILNPLSMFLISISILFWIYYIIIGIILSNNIKKMSDKGYLEIKKEGISDTILDKYNLYYSYDMLDFVGITNNYVFFYAKSGIFVYASLTDNDKRIDIIKTIHKYSNIKIIDNRDK